MDILGVRAPEIAYLPYQLGVHTADQRLTPQECRDPLVGRKRNPGEGIVAVWMAGPIDLLASVY